MNRQFDLKRFKAHLKYSEKISPLIWQTCKGYHVIGTNRCVLTLLENQIDDALYEIISDFGLSRPGNKLVKGEPVELSAEEKLIKIIDKPVWDSVELYITDLVRIPFNNVNEHIPIRYMSWESSPGVLSLCMVDTRIISIVEPDVPIWGRNPGLRDLKSSSSFYFTDQLVMSPVAYGFGMDKERTHSIASSLIQHQMEELT